MKLNGIAVTYVIFALIVKVLGQSESSVTKIPDNNLNPSASNVTLNNATESIINTTTKSPSTTSTTSSTSTTSTTPIPTPQIPQNAVEAEKGSKNT